MLVTGLTAVYVVAVLSAAALSIAAWRKVGQLASALTVVIQAVKTVSSQLFICAGDNVMVRKHIAFMPVVVLNDCPLFVIGITSLTVRKIALRVLYKLAHGQKDPGKPAMPLTKAGLAHVQVIRRGARTAQHLALPILNTLPVEQMGYRFNALQRHRSIFSATAALTLEQTHTTILKMEWGTCR
jgi:hypothetical protein